MCWTSNVLNRKIADHDIKTYKVLLKNTGYANTWYDVLYKSPIMSSEYIMGMMHMDDIKPLGKGVGRYLIDKGIHSYSQRVTFKQNENYHHQKFGIYAQLLDGHTTLYTPIFNNGKYADVRLYEPVIAECTIPKGASYYENEKGEIVSTQLIFEREAEEIMNSFKD